MKHYILLFVNNRVLLFLPKFAQHAENVYPIGYLYFHQVLATIMLNRAR